MTGATAWHLLRMRLEETDCKIVIARTQTRTIPQGPGQGQGGLTTFMAGWYKNSKRSSKVNHEQSS